MNYSGYTLDPNVVEKTDDFDDWFNWAAALLSAVNPRTA